MLMGRSETLNSFQLRVRWRMESRVTPGRMVPSSRGGVTSSRSPFSFCRNTNMFIVPTSVM